MPRPRRVHIDGAASYIHQEAQTEIELFKSEADYDAYTRLLKEYQVKYGFELYAYALTPQKVHLLLEPQGDISTSQFMRDLTSRYSKYYNGCYGHAGSLFHGRFKTVLVEKGEPLTQVRDYLTSLNTVTAGAAAFTSAGADMMAEALRGIAYGSAHFVEMVKQSMKAGAAEPVLSMAAAPAPIQPVAATAALSGAKIFTLSMAGAAAAFVLTAAVGGTLLLNRPAEKTKYVHSQAAESVPGYIPAPKAEAAPEVMTASKMAKKLVIVLDGTEWNVQLIPSDGVSEQDRKVEFDHLKFMSNRVASQKFATNGYDAAHYTVSQTPEGVIVWETIQRNSSGEMVSWRGEWAGEKMSGVLSKQLTDGKSQVFNFVGTMRDGSTGAAAGAAPKML